MLQDRQIDRALAVDVHDVGLRGEAVTDMRHIAQGDRGAVEDADRKGIEAINRARTGIQLHVVFPLANARGTGGHDDIGGL